MRLAHPALSMKHPQASSIRPEKRNGTQGLAFLRCWTVLICLILSTPLAGLAESASEDAVKAGFIYNFAKFTEWPVSPESEKNAPFLLCSSSGQPLSGKIALLQGRSVRGRDVLVRTNVRAEEWHNCHILFISDTDQQQLEIVLRTLNLSPVLTIGDSQGFAQAGGMIGLKTSSDRARFDINLAALRRVGLKLSSQVVSLADEVVK